MSIEKRDELFIEPEIHHPTSEGLRLPTIRRFPKYLRILYDFASRGRDVISSEAIAKELNLEPIVVRKDMACTGIAGKPRIGFNITQLISSIEELINLRDHSSAFLVGAGKLGSLLLSYTGFKRHGLNIITAFDIDSQKIGKTIYGREILSLDEFADLSRRMNVHLGILCVPNNEAQNVANLMIEAGIRGIWNFTNVELQVPSTIVVQNEDLAEGLTVLSVKLEKQFRKENELKYSIENTESLLNEK